MSVNESNLELPLALTHSWPLTEQHLRLDLGHLCCTENMLVRPDLHADALARQGIGHWECDLKDDSLTWTAGVFDLFGFRQGAAVARRDVLPLYEERSRAAMERLRAYAIKHQRGFTIDVEIVPPNESRRWIRLVAAPICIGHRVARLRGVKKDVSANYR